MVATLILSTRQHKPYCQIPHLYLDRHNVDHFVRRVRKETALGDQTLTVGVISQAYMDLRLLNGKQPADSRDV